MALLCRQGDDHNLLALCALRFVRQAEGVPVLRNWWQRFFSVVEDQVLNHFVRAVLAVIVMLITLIAYWIWAYFEDVPKSCLIPLAAVALGGISMMLYYATRFVDWLAEKRRREFKLSFKLDPSQHEKPTGKGKRWRVVVKNTGERTLDIKGVKIDAIKPVSGGPDLPMAEPSEAIGYFLCLARHDNPVSTDNLPLPKRFTLTPGEQEPISVVHAYDNGPAWLLVTDGRVTSKEHERFKWARPKRAQLGRGAYKITLTAVSANVTFSRDFKLVVCDEPRFELLPISPRD